MSGYYSFNSSRSINKLTDPVRLPDVDILCASANAMLAQMSDDEQREFWRDLDSVQADRFLLKESR